MKMHIGYRWFVGLSLEDKVPAHSTFSKNRHERFAENNIFQEIFDEIVGQSVGHGLLTGKHLTVDSTYIKANAKFKSLEPIVVDMNGKEYMDMSIILCKRLMGIFMPRAFFHQTI
ncbi:MAG: transposase [Nitrospirae bacterium]|nr:transposase [Nitrospirota bacterium]